MITGAICLLASAAYSAFMLKTSRQRWADDYAEMARRAEEAEAAGDAEAAGSLRGFMAQNLQMRRTLWAAVVLLPVLAVFIVAVAVTHPT